jgi:hypothetical protein
MKPTIIVVNVLDIHKPFDHSCNDEGIMGVEDTHVEVPVLGSLFVRISQTN